MVDPVTIGAIAATVLSMAAKAVFKGLVGEATKDAYNKLKDTLSRCAGTDVENLINDPDSVGRKSVITEVVDKLPQEQKDDIKILVDRLAESLEKHRTITGIEVGTLKAARIQLDKIKVTEGTGFRAQQIETPGEFRITDLTVGNPPGKTLQ